MALWSSLVPSRSPAPAQSLGRGAEPRARVCYINFVGRGRYCEGRGERPYFGACSGGGMGNSLHSIGEHLGRPKYKTSGRAKLRKF